MEEYPANKQEIALHLGYDKLLEHFSHRGLDPSLIDTILENPDKPEAQEVISAVALAIAMTFEQNRSKINRLRA